MWKHKAEIEAKFDGEIIWERLDGKKASRIKHEMPDALHQKFVGRFRDDEAWAEISAWYSNSMRNFHKAVAPVLDLVQKQLKNQ